MTEFHPPNTEKCGLNTQNDQLWGHFWGYERLPRWIFPKKLKSTQNFFSCNRIDSGARCVHLSPAPPPRVRSRHLAVMLPLCTSVRFFTWRTSGAGPEGAIFGMEHWRLWQHLQKVSADFIKKKPIWKSIPGVAALWTSYPQNGQSQMLPLVENCLGDPIQRKIPPPKLPVQHGESILPRCNDLGQGVTLCFTMPAFLCKVFHAFLDVLPGQHAQHCSHVRTSSNFTAQRQSFVR